MADGAVHWGEVGGEDGEAGSSFVWARLSLRRLVGSPRGDAGWADGWSGLEFRSKWTSGDRNLKLSPCTYLFPIAPWIPQDSSRVGDLLGGQGSASSLACSCDLSRWKDTEQNQQTKRCVGHSPEETREKLPRVLSVESHKTYRVPPSWIVTTRVKGCVPGKVIRDSAPRVFIGVGHRYPPPKFQTPRNKAGIQHKLYCLHKQFRHADHPDDQLGNFENTPETQVSRRQPRGSLAGRPFLRTSVSGLLREFLLELSAVEHFCSSSTWGCVGSPGDI